MHITQHTDYALRVLVYLGSNPDRLVTIQEISTCFDISRSHLMKVVNHLIRERFVEGLRGKGGGLRLGGAPESIVIGSVVRRMENHMELAECFGQNCSCLLDPGCKLKNTLANALGAFLRELDRVTLSDLLGEPQTKRLLMFPRAGAAPL